MSFFSLLIFVVNVMLPALNTPSIAFFLFQFFILFTDIRR